MAALQEKPGNGQSLQDSSTGDSESLYKIPRKIHPIVWIF